MNTHDYVPVSTPVTFIVDHDTFHDWLREITDKRHADDDGYLRPNFYIEEEALPSLRFKKVEAYLNTAEGTVIARHHVDDDQVTVTMRVPKPGPHLMQTVRLMLGEAA